MPTKFTGRVLTILVVMYVAFVTIYPRAPISIFLPLMDEPASWEHNLRPGIDMVGGTSLIYELVAPEGTPAAGLAEQVATALKRRVDPQGVRNLIWRPQGDTRLEIQMPLSGDSKVAAGIRDEYLAARDRLAELNVAPQQVIRVVENSTGEARQAELDRLAMGSPERQALFAELVSAFDAMKEAEASGSIPRIESARQAYNDAKARIDRTNLDEEQVEVALDANPEIRAERLEEFRTAAAGFPERKEALEAYIEAYTRFQEVRDEIADTASLKRLLQGSGVLAFHIVADDLPPDEYQQWYDRLMTSGPRPRAGDPVRWFQVERPESVGEWLVVPGPDGRNYTLVYMTDERALDGRDPEWGLERAGLDSDQRGGRAVAFAMNAMGARLFGDLTGAHEGRPMAIVLDDVIISAPTINQRISTNGIITGGRGGFSESEATYLINTLNAGALPAKLSDQPIAERTVGPQLGEDNLRAGLIACYFGLAVVGLFLIGYYYLSGVVAFIAVLMNMVLILASMAAINATFTLPSIAGIILALGMSVDANVLIFERLREEQARGLSIRMALRNAYDRALSAILDSNLTTGIVAIILYIFGSEEVAGFGLTLLIGIFASLFTALFVTKTIFGILVDKFGLADLGSIPRTFPRWDRFLTPNIDWVGMARAWSIASVAITIGGCALFGYYLARGNVLDIEFAGGTTAQVEMREPTTIGEMRDALTTDEGPLAGAQVVAIEPPAGLPDQVTYEVVVPNPDKPAVTGAIVAALGDRLNMRQASTFEGHDGDFAAAFEQTAFPIEPELTEVAGLPVDPATLAEHAGGVAIVLRDLAPMLTRQELLDRFSQQRLTGVYDAEGLGAGVRASVEVFPDQDNAVLMVSNDRYVYDAGDPDVVDMWRTEFAAPAWEMMRDAVSDPDELHKVTNIGAQVAGEFQRDATIALMLSLLGILAYVWLRFGDLKFGTAGVVSLLHDTFFTIAAIGYAHLLADTFIGSVLLLDPFRLNLTMVAAILTVVGFSINDTVVIFDRIRENRGKYGALTKQVINDSVNQTLSRTLLTGGTTIATILLMYIIGGPGIHGFTFAMLIGIAVGTYSSVMISAPLLLVGKTRDEAPASDADAGRMAVANP